MNPSTPFRCLLSMMAGQRRLVVCAMLLAALSVVSELLPWYLLWQAVQYPNHLMQLAGWLALALAVKYLLLALAGWFSHRAAFRVLYAVRMAGARGLTRLPLSRLSAFSSGSLRNIVINDVERMEGFIAQTVGIELFRHRAGIKRRAGGEGDPRAQRKGVLGVIRIVGPRLRNPRLNLQGFRVLPGQFVGYLVEDPAVRVKAARRWIEIGVGLLFKINQRAAVFGDVLCGI